MTRRAWSAALIFVLSLAPFPAWAQVARVTIEATASPVPALGGSALAFTSPALSAAATLTPGLAATLAPALVPTVSAPAALAEPAAYVAPMDMGAPVAPNEPHYTAIEVLALAGKDAASSPERVGRLFDVAPEAPDFDALTRVREPKAIGEWRPAHALLKHAANAYNSWRLARHEKTLNSTGSEGRVTTEERGMRESLTQAHGAAVSGRLQEALEVLLRLFSGPATNRWYRVNSAYQPYQDQAHSYLRFVERAVKRAYEQAHARAKEPTLVAEAWAATNAGTVIGHPWRATVIQEKDSAHCALHALHNAITASVGFTRAVSVEDFIASARRTLNRSGRSILGPSGDLAAVERALGYKIGVDVGEGMDAEAIKRWAKLLGLGVESRGPPSGDAQWSALLESGREILIGLRLFHEKHRYSAPEAAVHGHDYEPLHHEVYLLGAFDSPSRGVRLYMVQDSGSGATDFYTAEELTAVSNDIQLLTPTGPAVLP